LLTPKQHEPEVIAAKIGGLAGGKRRGGASLPHEADFSHIVDPEYRYRLLDSE
jgi:hypothetical protein